MGVTSERRTVMAGLLHYRPWRGQFRVPLWSAWPIARSAVLLLLRRKLFWVVYALGLLFFLMFFFGQYMLAYFQIPALGRLASEFKIFNGSADSYRGFFQLQS